MAAFLLSIVALLCLFLLAFFFYSVLFRVLKTTSDMNGLAVDEYLGILASTIFYSTLSVIGAFFTAISVILVHLYSNWKFYLLILAFGVLAETQLQYGPGIFETIDQENTQYGVPAYRNVILPILNFFRIIYRLGIPWINTIDSVGSIVGGSIITIGFDCTEQNWKIPVEKAIATIETLLISIVNFLVSLGTNDIDLITPIRNLTGLLASLEPFFACECKDLSFLFNFVFNTLNDPSTAEALNGAVNAVIELIRVVLRTFKDLFVYGLGFFTCDSSPDYNSKVQCLVNREPTFDGVASRLCTTAEGLGRFIDAITHNAVYSFLPDTFPVPRVGPFLGNLTCAAVTIAGDVLNIVFHADLIFPIIPSDPNVHYLQYVNIDKVFGSLRLAAGGIQIFFSDFRTQATDDVGCALASTFNISVNTLNVFTLFVIELASDPANILNFIQDGDLHITYIEADILNIGSCGAKLADTIDAPLGTWINQSAQLVVAYGEIWIDLIPQIPNFPTYVKQGTFKATIQNFLFYLDAFAIASGNLFRQFDHNGVSQCPLIDPITGQNNNAIQDVELFCCVGSGVEAIIRLVGAGLRYIYFTIIDLASGNASASTVFGAGGSGDLNSYVIPELTDLLDSVACIVPSFLSYAPNNGACPANSNSLQDSFFTFFKSLTSLLLIPAQLLQLIISTIFSFINNQSFEPCTLFTGLYNITLGKFAEVLYAFTVALQCIIPSGGVFDSIGNFINGTFTPDGTFIQGICAIISGILSVITFFIDLFKYKYGPAQYIFDQIQSFIVGIFNAAIAPIETAISSLQADFVKVEAAFSCLKDGITQFFSSLGSCIGSCFIHGCNDCSSFSVSGCNIKRDSSSKVHHSRYNEDSLFNYTMDDPSSPCYLQIMASRNDTYPEDILRVLRKDAAECIQSVAISKFIDRVLLFQTNNTLPDIVDPYAFYDPVSKIKILENLSKSIPAFIQYEFNFLQETIDYTGSVLPNQTVYSSQTWMNFSQANGITDPLSVRLGLIGDVFLHSMKNSESQNPTNFISLIFQICYNLWKMLMVGGSSSSTSAWTNLKRGINHLPEVRAAMYHTYSTLRFENRYQKIYDVVGNTTLQVAQWWEEKSYTTDDQLIRNRIAVFSIQEKIASRVAFYKNKHDVYTPEERKRREEDRTDYFASYNGTLYPSQGKRAFNVVEYICIAGKCLNCTLLDEVIDKSVELIILTLNDTQRPIDVSEDFYLNGNVIVKPPAPAFHFPDLTDFSALRNDTSTSGGLAVSVAQYLTFGSVDIRYVGDYIAYFFTNKDATDVNSFRFWLGFSLHCEYETMPRCADNPPGLGFYPALRLFIIIFLVALVVFSVAIPGSGSIVLTIAMFLFFPFILTVGYFMSPWCGLPKFPLGLPLLPDCLGDDIFIGFKEIDYDCIPWDSTFPGLTSPICPGPAENYRRDFPDWKRYPYLFKDGLRNIFFLFEWKLPVVNDFLRTTGILLFSWIREVDYINQLLTFDFGPQGIDSTWITYFWITIYAIFLPVAEFFLILLVGLSIFIPVILVITAVLSVLSAGSILLISLVLNLFVSGGNQRGYYKNRSEFDFLYL